MFGSIGFPELILVFIVVMLVFGPKKLPEFARTLGRIVREFRSTVDQAKTAIQDEVYKEGLADPILDLRRGIQEVRAIGDDIHLDLKQALDGKDPERGAESPAPPGGQAGAKPEEAADGQAES